MGARIVLRIVDGPSSGIDLELHPDQVLEVGRRTRGLAIADDEQLSGQHFLVVCEGEGCSVRDLRSTNGTFVNTARVGKAVLRDGDEITAGRSKFVVRIERDVAPVSTRRPVSERAEPNPTADERPRNVLSASDSAEVGAGDLLRINNRTPFAATTLYWQDDRGRAKLTIVVKATFSVGTPTRTAPQQVPIFKRDVPHEGNVDTSVRFESDLVPCKPRADVILVGRAHAPERRPVTQLGVGLRVGKLEYSIAVWGDRVWEFQAIGPPTISKPRPFTTMDLVYERAFGGMDAAASLYCAENLAGTGFIGKKTRERITGLRLPNLEERGNLIGAWNSRPSPAGFGFYGRGWTPRREQFGTDGFFNAAHPRLQAEGYLKGDEEVELVNVSRAPCPRFRLPGVRPTIEITRLMGSSGGDGGHEILRPVLDTVVFIPDDGVFYETFRAVCDLPSFDAVDVATISIAL